MSAEYAYFFVFNERISPVILSSASEVTLNMGAKVATPIIKFFIPLFILNVFLTIKITKELKALSVKKILFLIATGFLVIIIPLSLVIYKYYATHPNKMLAMHQLKHTPFELLKDMVYIRYPLVTGDMLYLAEKTKLLLLKLLLLLVSLLLVHTIHSMDIPITQHLF